MADRFPLVMDDGSEVDENLEELKEKFDVNSIVGHFLAGRLEEWLRARYFDEKADEVAALDKDAEDLGRQLCEIFGVDTGNVDDVDVGYIERLNEKKNILRQKTADERIIANANLTAFTQTDLADLLDLNEPVIYLCGKKFNIPIRIEHKIYKGILGQPKIDINAKSEAELKEHDIKFENVELPFRSCRESVAENIYERRGSEKENNGQEAVDNFVQIINKSEVTSTINNENPISSNASYSQRRLKYTAFIKNFVKEFHIWNIATTRDRVSYEPTTEEKLVCIETVCQGKCHEEDILYLAVTSDFSAGLAFTLDSFFYIYQGDEFYIPYKHVSIDHEKRVEDIGLFFSDYVTVVNDTIVDESSGAKLNITNFFPEQFWGLFTIDDILKILGSISNMSKREAY